MKIVGIGASAGGLEAFQALFRNLPPNSGMAFVVILHLPSGRKSILPEIIGRWTEMPVVEAVHGATIEPNHIYVPPPHAVVSIDDSALRILQPADDAPRDYRPIDGFFDALARARRDEAIGIVLSGTGSDGALGLKAIKECGGFTIAQGRNNGSFPQYEDMPAGAIATGAVDLIAAAEVIPLHLMRLAGATAPIEATALTAEELDTMRLELCAILRSEVGHDFSHYRDKTFMRRVQRRMQVCGLGQVDDYIERLRTDHEEVMLLFRDLLIRVTSFFRDIETFTTLSRLVMPLLFANKHAADAVRVWVPGCAPGRRPIRSPFCCANRWTECGRRQRCRCSERISMNRPLPPLAPDVTRRPCSKALQTSGAGASSRPPLTAMSYQSRSASSAHFHRTASSATRRFLAWI